MAKKASEEVIIDVEGQYSKFEQFLEEKKNLLAGVGVALAVIIGGYFGYTQLYLAPLEEEAQEQIWKAQQYFEQDSFNLAIQGDGNYLGFEDIIDMYGQTQAANLAKYYLGISYLRTGEFALAIEYLDKFSSNDPILQYIALGATGDAFMELGDVEAAIDYYKKASKSENSFVAPIYLMKLGLGFELSNDFEKAAEAYEKIKKDFPKSQEARTIDKYIFRAKGRA